MLFLQRKHKAPIQLVVLFHLKRYDYSVFSVGSSPDMVSPTKDCTLVVAIENEGFIENGRFYDPPGGVGIIRFPKGIDLKPEVKILNFTAFDKQ